MNFKKFLHKSSCLVEFATFEWNSNEIVNLTGVRVLQRTGGSCRLDPANLAPFPRFSHVHAPSPSWAPPLRLAAAAFLLLHPLGSPGVDRFSSPSPPTLHLPHPSATRRRRQPPHAAATTATPATMGASTSTSNPSLEAQEQETLASASLALPLLRAAFSRSNGSLAEALSPPPAAFRSDSPPVPPRFHDLVARLGPAIASLFFSDVGPAGDAAGWLGFLRGFNRCCARVPASQSLALLLRVYAAACADAGAPCGLQFHPDEDGAGGEGKVVGELAPGEIAVLLWMCWVMAWSGSAPGVSGGQEGGGKGEPVLLPDVTHLVLSALVSAGAVADDAGVWGWEVSRGGKGVKVQEFTSWVLSTAAGLGNCLSRYVQERFRSCAADPVEVSKLHCRVSNLLWKVSCIAFVLHRTWILRTRHIAYFR